MFSPFDKLTNINLSSYTNKKFPKIIIIYNNT